MDTAGGSYCHSPESSAIAVARHIRVMIDYCVNLIGTQIFTLICSDFTGVCACMHIVLCVINGVFVKFSHLE